MLVSTLLILAALAIVAANAFFVASEFAIVKMRPTRLEELAAGGGRRARTALGISRRLDAYLSANQLAITLTSLALGWIGEPAFARLLTPVFARLGSWAGPTAHTIAATLAFLLITFLHVVLGELTPKSIAIRRTESVALWTAGPLHAFYRLAYPATWALNAGARITLRLFGMRPASEVEMLHSPGELRIALRRAVLEPGTQRLIDRLFDYARRRAGHVMTLRRDVVVLAAGRPFAESLETVLASQYTRYPLVEPATGAVLGYVHLKALMAAVAAGRTPELRDIARQPLFATEDTPLETLRREFQRRRVHLAVVADRAGVFTGIVTLEDLLEEFVGEILDEQDAGEVPPLVRQPGGRFDVDGRLTLDVAQRELGLRLAGPAGVETLGAWVAARLGRTPRPGNAVVAGGARLVVTDVRDGLVRRLRGEPVEPPANGG